MPSILDRYVFREILQSFAAVTGVLLLILMSGQLAKVLGQAAQESFPASVVGTLIGLATLQQLTVLVPIGLFLGIMLALGRLYHDSEMTAMAACGLGQPQLYRPVLMLALPVAVLLAWLSFEIVPGAARHAQEIRIEALRSAQFGALEPGRFRSFAGGDAVFYAERVDPDGLLHRVFVQRRVGERVEVAIAERAVQRGAGLAQQEFVLYDGRRYEGEPGSREWRIVEFREHGIAVRLPDVRAKKKKHDVKGTGELRASSDPDDRAELAWRRAVPAMLLTLAVLAVPLARLRPRQGRFARIGVAVIAYFAYSNLLAAARVWIEKDEPIGALGLWWVHLIPLLLAGWLLWRENRPRAALLRWPWTLRKAAA